MPVITAVAYKPTPDSKVGIAFVANRISKISATSLFASSDLRVGQQVLSINDEPVNGKSATEMAAVIASAPEEVKIKVIAEASVPVITAVANKPTPDSKVGIAFVANRISKINEGSFFASSDLRVGHTVVSINDKPADGKSATLAAIIASAPKEVKIKVIAGPNVEINKSKAPNGAPEGGIWGIETYAGGATQAAACVGFLCFCLPGCLILCCPFDERDVYKAGNIIYDPEGKQLGPSRDVNFRASGPNTMRR